MADKITTFRSDYYKRRKPGVGSRAKPIKWSEEAGFYKLDPNDREKLLEQDKLNSYTNALKDIGIKALPDIAPWFTKPSEDPRLLTRRQALIEANPWLPFLLAEAAKMRYDVLTGKGDEYNSKKYGVAEYWNPPPDEDEYFKWTRGEDGKLVAVPTDAGKELMESNPDYYEFRHKPFADYDEDAAFSLAPLTKEEADADGVPWFHSTNDYLDALLATRLGEENRQALYEEAHDALGEYLSSLIKEGKLDVDRASQLHDEAGFKPENIIESGVKNFFTPVRHAVTADPELRKKTKDSELTARTAADIGLGAGGMFIPWGGAILGAGRMSRPGLGAFIGGALGGLANYGLERGVNEAFDRYTGYGSDNQPVDLTDATASALAGGLTGRLMAANRVKGWNKVREHMNELEPRTVTRGDVKSSFAASKASGGDVKQASPLHSTNAMKKYRELYPNGAMQVERTELEADGIPLATNLPNGNLRDLINSTQGKKFRLEAPRGDFGGFITGRDPAKRIGIPSESETTVRKRTPNGMKANTAHDVVFTEPPVEKVAWAKGDDNRFTTQMVKDHPEYYQVDFLPSGLPNVKKSVFSVEDITQGLPKTAKKAQTAGSIESKMFGNEPLVVKNDDFAALQAAFSGSPHDEGERMKKAFLRKMLKKSEAGTVENGTFKEGSSKQKKIYKQGLKDYGRRAGQKIISKHQADKAMSNNLKTGAAKVGGALIGPMKDNVIPFGSNMTFGVQPIEYEE